MRATKPIVNIFATGKSMPILFLNISPGACNKVRMMLKMTNSESYFLDIQSNDVTRKRITILPKKLKNDDKAILKHHFGSNITSQETK